MIAQRILTVLTAICLVGAIAIGSLAPQGWPLSSLVFSISRNAGNYIGAQLHAGTPHWFWNEVVGAFLVRPAWLLPALSGIVCGGLCLTLASRHRQPSRRPRS